MPRRYKPKAPSISEESKVEPDSGSNLMVTNAFGFEDSQVPDSIVGQQPEIAEFDDEEEEEDAFEFKDTAAKKVPSSEHSSPARPRKRQRLKAPAQASASEEPQLAFELPFKRSLYISARVISPVTLPENPTYPTGILFSVFPNSREYFTSKNSGFEQLLEDEISYDDLMPLFRRNVVVYRVQDLKFQLEEELRMVCTDHEKVFLPEVIGIDIKYKGRAKILEFCLIGFCASRRLLAFVPRSEHTKRIPFSLVAAAFIAFKSERDEVDPLERFRRENKMAKKPPKPRRKTMSDEEKKARAAARKEALRAKKAAQEALLKQQREEAKKVDGAEPDDGWQSV